MSLYIQIRSFQYYLVYKPNQKFMNTFSCTSMFCFNVERCLMPVSFTTLAVCYVNASLQCSIRLSKAMSAALIEILDSQSTRKH